MALFKTVLSQRSLLLMHPEVYTCVMLGISYFRVRGNEENKVNITAFQHHQYITHDIVPEQLLEYGKGKWGECSCGKMIRIRQWVYYIKKYLFSIKEYKKQILGICSSVKWIILRFIDQIKNVMLIFTFLYDFGFIHNAFFVLYS